MESRTHIGPWASDVTPAAVSVAGGCVTPSRPPHPTENRRTATSANPDLQITNIRTPRQRDARGLASLSGSAPA